MSCQAEIKRSVLRGVYEENLGIPRSSVGNGRTRSDTRSVTRDETDEGAFGSGTRRKAVLITIVAVVALLGINIHLSTIGDAGLSAGPAAMGLGSPGDVNALYGSSNLRGKIIRDIGLPAGFEPIKSIETAVGAASQYDTLLSQIGVPMAELFGLKVHTIVIDPGHGGIDPGATGPTGLKEKDVALDIARRLRDKLARSGRYRVLLTRDADEKVFLKERVAFAKAHDADLFISIHANSLPVESINYVETYYFGPHTDQTSLDLSEKENEDSDYAMGEFREIIAKIGDTLKSEESKGLAESIHRHLYSDMQRRNGALLDAGAKTGPFVVLLGVEVPSVLVEVSCISNKAEETRLGTSGYRDSIAAFLEKGIAEYLDRRAYKNTLAGGEIQHVASQER